MTAINGPSGNLQAYDVLLVDELPASDVATLQPQLAGDSYDHAFVASPDAITHEVLPYEGPAAGDQPDVTQGTADAEHVLAQLTSPDAVFVDPVQADQAAGALTQLLAASDASNAGDLAPAIAFWTEVGQASLASTASQDAGPNQVFNENATFTDGMSPEVQAAWEQVFTTVEQNLDAMINGPYDMDASDVAAMQGALADANYALAMGAQFEGNTGAAMDAAALALSYVQSLEASGADVSQYANLVSDMQVLVDTGVLNLSYLEMNAIVDTGQIVAVGADGQPVSFDIRDLAMMTDTELPDGVAPPLVNPDPSTDVGYDGAGLVLNDAAGGSSFDTGGDTFDTGGDSFDLGGGFGGGSSNLLFDVEES